MLARLSTDVRRKVRALRKVQLETTNIEVEFHRKVYELEREYQDKHEILFKKRSDIIK